MKRIDPRRVALGLAAPLLAIVVAFVAAYATARWLEGIFGVGQISGTVSFLVLVGLIGAAWWINSRAGKRRNELLGSARFGDRADVRKLEATGGSPDRPRQGIRQAAPL